MRPFWAACPCIPDIIGCRVPPGVFYDFHYPEFKLVNVCCIDHILSGIRRVGEISNVKVL